MKNLILMILPLILSGCSSLQLDNESHVLNKPRDYVCFLRIQPTMADYTRFAEKVTDKMLRSKLVQKWGTKKPRLVVSKSLNYTDDENIRMQDVYDRISEIILASGQVRLMDKSTTSFDYELRSELSSTRTYNEDDEELTYFKLQFKLYKHSGEIIGLWSDLFPLRREKRQYI